MQQAATWSCESAVAVRKVREMGQMVETKAGNRIQNLHMAIMNRQAVVMLKAGKELGFSPSARRSLGGEAIMPEQETGRRRRRKSDLQKYLDEKPDDLVN
jgi:phage terminase small subunit